MALLILHPSPLCSAVQDTTQFTCTSCKVSHVQWDLLRFKASLNVPLYPPATHLARVTGDIIFGAFEVIVANFAISCNQPGVLKVQLPSQGYSQVGAYDPFQYGGEGSAAPSGTDSPTANGAERHDLAGAELRGIVNVLEYLVANLRSISEGSSHDYVMATGSSNLL